MKLYWFIRKGIISWPASVAGWIIFIAATVYSIYLFIDIDSRSHSVSDTLMNWAFSVLIVVIVYSAIAFLTGKRN